MKAMKKGKLEAFTLTELLVVLVIIGILALIALPQFGDVANSARDSEAEVQLNAIYQRQSTYHMKNLKYASSLEELGFVQPKLTEEGGNGYFNYRITDAGTSSFVAEAEASLDWNENGQKSKWSINHEQSLQHEVHD